MADTSNKDKLIMLSILVALVVSAYLYREVNQMRDDLTTVRSDMTRSDDLKKVVGSQTPGDDAKDTKEEKD